MAAASTTAPTDEAGLHCHPATQAASDVLHRVLGTSMPLSQITQVRMHVFGKCKMGISFWPTFRFKAPDREEQPGSVKLVYGTPPSATAGTAPAAVVGGAAGPDNTTTTTNTPVGADLPLASGHQQQQPQQAQQLQHQSPEAQPEAFHPEIHPASGPANEGERLLHISFTRDPPDEVNVGAKFLGRIPFPFITIRTNKLEGTLDPETGAITLLFDASFIAQVGKREPTCLPINATLTTEAATAFNTRMQGKRLEGGQGVLVSAAEVPKTPKLFANLILWLPAAATAKLPVRFEFS